MGPRTQWVKSTGHIAAFFWGVWKPATPAISPCSTTKNLAFRLYNICLIVCSMGPKYQNIETYMYCFCFSGVLFTYAINAIKPSNQPHGWVDMASRMSLLQWWDPGRNPFTSKGDGEDGCWSWMLGCAAHSSQLRTVNWSWAWC